MPKLMLLSLEHIRTTEKKRRGICPHRIETLRIALEMGEDIPPIRVNLMNDNMFVVKDGRHRIGAHKLAGMTQIWAVVENIMRRLCRKWSALAHTPCFKLPKGSFFFPTLFFYHVCFFQNFVHPPGLEPGTSRV